MFIDQLRAKGHAVESICRVLREQGVQIAARTYRVWKQPDRPIAARTVSDAVRDAARTVTADGVRQLTPEGLYGRRKMLALLRRSDRTATVSPGAVDRAVRLLGLSGVRRDKGIRTTIPAKDGIRAGDLLDRDFTAPAPDRVWVTDFTYCRTWAGWVPDVFAQGSVNLTVYLGLLVEMVQARAAVRRPSNRMSKAFSACFQRMVQRARPLPVGSRAMTAR
jgi:putative transposase